MGKKNVITRVVPIVLMMYLSIFSILWVTGADVHADATMANLNPNAVPQQQAVNYTAIAEEAYIFGYPLLTFYITMKVATNVPVPLPSGDAAPINQFANRPKVPNPNFTGVVTPNADTLYSSAWLDLSKGPIVLSVPDTHGRYYLMPMLDAWGDVFASPGKRTTGTAAGNFLIVGPSWNGTVPSGMTEFRSATDLVWILGRTEVNATSTADIVAVNAIQKQYKLTPLRAWGTNYTPPVNIFLDPTVNMSTPPKQQVDELANDPNKCFSLLNKVMANNPPYAADAPMMAQLAQIGIVPGQPFNWNNFSPQAQSQILTGTQSVLAELQTLMGTQGGRKLVNGWSVAYGDIGNVTNIPSQNPNTLHAYLLRAYLTSFFFGANLPQDAMYPMSQTDANGQPYSGANDYVMHFDSGQTPPYYGFWSLSMYDSQTFTFVANPINRYAIGNGNPLKYNKDGSLDIYIQNADPGPDKESNWLPAPTGAFYLVLRVYWPQPAMLNGQWVPPPVIKVTPTQTSTSTMMPTNSTMQSAPTSQPTENTTSMQAASVLVLIVVIALGIGLYMRRRKSTTSP